MVTRGWNSLDKGSALTRVGYCSREALNCETSLCILWEWECHKIWTERKTLIPLLCQEGKHQL